MYVIHTANMGSSAFFVPWPNMDNPGMRWSRASACNSFADPITPISTEKSDVASSPIRMMIPDKFVCGKSVETLYMLTQVLLNVLIPQFFRLILTSWITLVFL